MTKVAVYIDGPHFLHGTRGQGISMDLDLSGLLRSTLPGAEIVRTVYFNVVSPREIYPSRNDHEQVIFTRFEDQGIEIRRCRIEVKAHVLFDRGLEAGLATEMIVDATKGLYDTAVVISRRAELASPIRAVQSLGKKVTVLFYEFEVDPSNALKETADSHVRLEVAQVLKFRRSGPKPVFAY
jgi:uncharacterized LabA/DUF88 family protein